MRNEKGSGVEKAGILFLSYSLSSACKYGFFKQQRNLIFRSLYNKFQSINYDFQTILQNGYEDSLVEMKTFVNRFLIQLNSKQNELLQLITFFPGLIMLTLGK
jgi:hypothetical protein